METATDDIGMTQQPVPARLLFLSANANDRSPLAVDREYNRVQSGLQALGVWQHWRAAVEHLPAVTWEQVPAQLLLHAPSIVHFAGHGYPDGSLEFSTHSGAHQRIHPDGLARVFESYADQIRLVVLNACYSDALAAALTAHIDVIVGMTEAISDERAILFAPAFYQQLAGGKSVQTAFEVGCAVLLGQAFEVGSSPRDVQLDPSRPASPHALPHLRVRAGVDASRLRFAVPAVERTEEVPELLGDIYVRLLAGYAPDAVIRAGGVAERALRVIVGKPSARLGDLLDELRRGGHPDLLADASWLHQRVAAARPVAGQVRGDFDDDGRRASEIAARLAIAAGLVTPAESTAYQHAAQESASEPASTALLRLDRATHRKVLDDRLERPHRVLMFLAHGEIDQGHDHFGEIMTWRLRSGRNSRWREIVVRWPQPSMSLGVRLAMLLEDLAHALGVRLTPPPDDPATAEGAKAWAPALLSILGAIDASRERLLVRHVLRCPRTGPGGDDALVEAYVHRIWAAVAERSGERVVVGLDLRRIERGGVPLGKAWRISRGELAASRAIATVLDRMEIAHGVICSAFPELGSVAAPDLIDWLRSEAARTGDVAEAEASQLVSSTRGGRFDLIIQRLMALDLDRNRSTRR